MATSDPVPIRPLVGREADLRVIQKSLLSEQVRLLTITGLAGIGKSQLAMAVVAELAPAFPGGTHFIRLGHLRDPDRVMPAIARALGKPEFAVNDVFEVIATHFGKRSTLLTLDNIEHVTQAGAELIRLLERCPNLKILATSRTPFRLPEELIVPLSPLAIPNLGQHPSVEALRANDSVTLLVQRVRDFDPEFTLTETNASDIAEICVHLGGVPLAIELAATRLRVLSPSALKGRLSSTLAILTSSDPSAPQHHRSLRAAIASSEALLSPPSRRLFRLLSVFAGGCDAAAVEAICADGEAASPHACEILDALCEILQAGLLHRVVVANDPRFVMPEPVCEFALEQLEAAGESEWAHHRHAAYFMTMAEEAAPSLIGADQQAWFVRLTTELENVRAALRWSLRHDPDLALRTAAALWRFWYARGYLREGSHWLERALAATEVDTSVPRVRALNGLGVLVWASGNAEHSLRLQEASLALAQEIGDTWGVAVAQADHAVVEYEIDGDPERISIRTEQALAAFRELGDRHLEAIAIITLGDIALIKGDLDAATRHFQKALAIAREIEDITSQALCLFNLAQVARREGHPKRAEEYHLEALALADRIGGQEDVLYNLAGLAGLAADQNQFERAAQLLGATVALRDATGIALQPMEQAQIDLDLAKVKRALPNGTFARAWNDGAARSPSDLIAMAVASTVSTGNGGATHGLSHREIEVLRLLANGSSDREIAEALFISSETASTHVKNIRRKLGVHSRAAAAAYAIRQELI
jgi:predicted ATPase/DNA-binding CsgD family transcriptional regulator